MNQQLDFSQKVESTNTNNLISHEIWTRTTYDNKDLIRTET